MGWNEAEGRKPDTEIFAEMKHPVHKAGDTKFWEEVAVIAFIIFCL